MENVRNYRDIKRKQPKKEGIIWRQNETIIQKKFFLDN